MAIVFLEGLRLLHGGWLAPLSTVGSAAFQFEMFAGMVFFGWWIAGKTTAWPVLHGALVGVCAVLIYEILAFGQPVPRNWFYFLAHGLKIGGGAVGGWLAARRARAPMSASVSQVAGA